MLKSLAKHALRPALAIVPRPAGRSADFDFFMGIWKCHHRYLVRRLAGCHDWLEFDGTCAARKILDGWGNTDENDIRLPGTRYTGMSLRTWNPDTSRWSIYWLDSRRPGHVAPPVRGGFEDGRSGKLGIFYGDDEIEGLAIRVRFLWSRITPDSARWEQAFSRDEGNSWETNWYMDFTRL
jgi:hypothetical protein